MTKYVKSNSPANPQTSPELFCGIIMPIAEMEDYPESHWLDVKNIITEAAGQVKEYNFKTEIVSDSGGEINIIHKNIISNIYDADMVICDISGRNPNVLFELGMRLTFDKPTIIIKDDITPFIFDTSAIETLIYPKDLRFGPIVRFKETLAKRLKLTYEKSVKDPSYSTFLGNFGEFKVPKLDQTAVTEPQEIILAELASIKENINILNKEFSNKPSLDPYRHDNIIRTSSLKLRLIDDVSLLITKYLTLNPDSRPAKEVMKSANFRNFINSEGAGLNIDRISTNEVVNIIENTQKKLNIIEV